jgi:hypothetical protein
VTVRSPVAVGPTWAVNDAFAILRRRLAPPAGLGRPRTILVRLRRPGLTCVPVITAGGLSVATDRFATGVLRTFCKRVRRQHYARQYYPSLHEHSPSGLRQWMHSRSQSNFCPGSWPASQFGCTGYQCRSFRGIFLPRSHTHWQIQGNGWPCVRSCLAQELCRVVSQGADWSLKFDVQRAAANAEYGRATRQHAWPLHLESGLRAIATAYDWRGSRAAGHQFVRFEQSMHFMRRHSARSGGPDAFSRLSDGRRNERFEIGAHGGAHGALCIRRQERAHTG